MLQQIFSLYIQGLLIATFLVVAICALWTFVRVRTKKDKTAQERQAFLLDMVLITILVIPILSFAIMSILLVGKA
ncbi:DUF4059 family protein [Streptococcus halichoeri]|uniref:DUF4059 family protein n=1 Tax=Streptococcus halichoeri TaxID=254785 RepID=UPI000DB2AF6D|nr:DUF4059 family protein [Streptococcus halichoeri]PZO96352.1 MAG: DUF4059 domain-containing protein [Streptococcus pyogenes]